MIKKIEILRTPGCSSCGKATVLIKKIKKENNLKFTIKEFDITKHPDMLMKYQIMTSPGIVIDGKLEFTGLPSEKKLKEKLMTKG